MRRLSYFLLFLIVCLLAIFFFRTTIINKTLASIHPELEITIEDLTLNLNQSRIKNLQTSYVNNGKKSAIAKVNEIVIDYSISQLLATPHTITAIEVNDSLISLEGAFAAKGISFEDGAPPIGEDLPTENTEATEKQNAKFALGEFSINNLQIDASNLSVGNTKVNIPKVRHLSLKGIKDKHFSSASEMINYLIKSLVKQLKGQKTVESLLINTGLLPKNIIQEGLRTPENIFNLIPQVINKLESDREPRENNSSVTPVEGAEKKRIKNDINSRLKKLIKTKKASVSHKNKKLKKEDRDYQPVPFEELEDIFKGIPEKLFEKE